MDSVSDAPALERLSTGVEALDALTGGGIPSGSLTMVTGRPGAGKTVFAMQALFQQAAQGKRCLYLTTLSEPALKLIRYSQQFSFFDASLIDDRVHFVDLGTTLLSDGPAAALAVVRARLEAEEPDFVVVDSFKAIHDLTGGDLPSARVLPYELAVALGGWGCTTLLLGEYAPEDVTGLPEFAIADGIIQLSNERQGLTRVRALEIQKLRGANYVPGMHFFEIRSDGLHFYPRVRAGDPDLDGTWIPGRAPFGLQELDAMLDGGLPTRSTTLLEGGSGSGKTLLALRFLIEGARRGEAGLHFGLEEAPAQLRGVAASFGWELPALEREGLIRMRYTAPVELNPDQLLGESLEAVRALGARRVVLDSAGALALGVDSDRRFRELIHALASHLRAADVTSLVTIEVPDLLGSTQLAGGAVSSIADNVLLLRYIESEGRLERAIAVLKARGVHHDSRLHGYRIGAQGPEVGAAFTSYRGVLSGLLPPTGEHVPAAPPTG